MRLKRQCDRELRINIATHVHKSGRAQKQVIFLHLLRMNHTEVSSDVRVAEVRPFKLFIFFVCKVGHRALELSNDSADREGASGQNTQFGFACTVGIAGGMCDFN